MRFPIAGIVCGIGILLHSTLLFAAPDQYPGDTSIYGGVVAAMQPNVLIIIDTSGSMTETVPGSSEPYDPATTYPALKVCNNSNCSANSVYYASNNSLFLNSVNSVTTSCASVNPQDLLKTTGQYSGRKLNTDGTCANKKTSSYVLGNYLNWLNGPGKTTYKQKIVIAKDVVKNIVQSTNGVQFGLMRYNGNNGSKFVSATVSSSTYTATIKNMDDIFTGTTTNRAALVSSVDTLSASGNTPLAESLFEALRYFQGGKTAFSNTVGVDASGNYTSPIKASCQQNYIIFVTDGMSTADDSTVLKSICSSGDCDADGKEPGDLSHAMDDVAKYLFDTDLSTSFDGKQNVKTFTIGFGLGGADADAVDLLNRVADSNHGHGQAYLAGNQADLSTALTQIVSNILEINTSFVAPVVPVSPENRTASASRVYIGLFKPNEGNAWEGNIKKYGLNSQNYLTDKNGNYANYVDLNDDGRDDRTGDSLPLGAVNGSFVLNSTSFWSTSVDAGDVTNGGVGEQLLTRSSARNLYTYLGTSTTLTNSTNAFSTSNTALTYSLMDMPSDTEKNKVINFIHGYDAYDDNSNGNTTEKREWIMGDVLHSKPVVVNYSKYTFNATSEADCTINKTKVFVGSNDGFLHAFNDCDGSEAWAFVPAELLPNLQYVHSGNHTYFVDASAFTYIYDKNNNGVIEPSDGDRVIMLVGLRRGGGTNVVPATGYNYALDITNADAPVFLWKLDNETAAYPELAEAWSEPKIVKLKIGATYKIAAVIGGGYDNLNEDARFGATQTFPGTGAVSAAATGAGAVTSSGTSAQNSPMGRALYLVELAELSTAGVPNFANSGAKIWGMSWGSTSTITSTARTSSTMTFSFPAEVAVVDSQGRGYTDKLYAVDSGGNLWRFDLTAAATTDWTGRKVFSPNPGSGGSSDTGRKAFYKPSVVRESGYDYVFYGTGDREHPLNTNVVDRVYAVKVRDGESAATPVKTESSLVDVTEDLLQSTTIANVSADKNNPTVGSVAYILKQLTEKEGWYIRLNESNGEKVLASPTVFNKVLYLTTFLPQGVAVVDPCQPANLGASNVYALNYLTGEAVLDYSGNGVKTAGNNTTVTTNERAKSGNLILQRLDRKKSIGQGIASGTVVVVSDTGKVNLVIGEGGNIVLSNATKGGVVRTLFWRQK